MLAEVEELVVREPGQNRAVQYHHIINIGENYSGE